MLCSDTKHSTNTYDRHSVAYSATSATNSASATASTTDATSTSSAYVHSAGLHTTKSYIQFLQTNSPGAHLHLNKGKASWVFHSSFQNYWFYMYIHILHFFFTSFVSDFTLSTLVLFLLVHFYISLNTHSPYLLLLLQKQTTRRKGEISYLIFSFFNDKRLLAPKYSEYFTWSAPPLLYSWSNSLIGCSAPLYSWSGSLIGLPYYFLYISFCFRLNRSLTNLTLLHQHHFQYTLMKFGSVKLQILILITVIFLQNFILFCLVH